MPKSKQTKQTKTKANNNGSTIRGVYAPISKSSIVRPRPARITTTPNGGVVVCNTEVIFNNLTTAAGAAYTNFNRPLIPSNFPWLAGVAVNYSKVKWRKIRYVYVPFCSTTAVGRLAMGLTYDAGDTNPTSVDQIATLNKGVLSPVWGNGAGTSNNVIIDVDVNNFPLGKYTYIGSAAYTALTSNTDRNFYCPTTLQIGTDNGISGSVGSVMVMYEVELMEPVPAAINL